MARRCGWTAGWFGGRIDSAGTRRCFVRRILSAFPCRHLFLPSISSQATIEPDFNEHCRMACHEPSRMAGSPYRRSMIDFGRASLRRCCDVSKVRLIVRYPPHLQRRTRNRRTHRFALPRCSNADLFTAVSCLSSDLFFEALAKEKALAKEESAAHLRRLSTAYITAEQPSKF